MALTKILHKGREIVVADFSNKKGQELIDAMKQFDVDLIAEGKVQRILMDQTNIVMSTEIKDIQKQSAVKIKPYQEKLAIIGIKGPQMIIARAIMSLVKANVRLFEKKEEAMDWLAEA